jgi:hypothetical protein
LAPASHRYSDSFQLTRQSPERPSASDAHAAAASESPTQLLVQRDRLQKINRQAWQSKNILPKNKQGKIAI